MGGLPLLPAPNLAFLPVAQALPCCLELEQFTSFPLPALGMVWVNFL